MLSAQTPVCAADDAPSVHNMDKADSDLSKAAADPEHGLDATDEPVKEYPGMWKIAKFLGLDPPKNPRSAKEVIIGEYDFSYLCMPQWPYCRTNKRANPEFYHHNQWLGIVVGFLMGLQHVVAMAGGLVTPPILISALSPNDPDLTQILISYAFIVVSVASALQVSAIRFSKNWQYGSGVLSVMGVSFATVPIAQAIIRAKMFEGATFDEAYGALLGTLALCSVTGLFIAVLPHRILRKLFPPVVCGVTLILIGAKLVGSGMRQWGGGAFCADNWKGLTPISYAECSVMNVTSGTMMTMPCQTVPIVPKCNNNGEVMLNYGAGAYFGLGFVSFGTIIFLEIFGSPFMRNASAMLALLVGYIVAACIKIDGQSFIRWSVIADAPWFTFLWTRRFPLSIYAPGILPVILIYVTLAIESVGDVTGTEEASRLKTRGEDHERRIRGGIINDSISSLFASLAMTMPVTTFAQNNGVIALTNVSSRYTGYFCAIILFTLGVVVKFGAWVTTIPHCVLGGVTTFLFASVIVGGIKIIANDGITRRTRVIMACSVGLGLGVILVPQWARGALWKLDPMADSVTRGLYNTLMMIIGEGFVLGALVAIICNLIIPEENTAGDEEKAAAIKGSSLAPDAALPTAASSKRTWIPKQMKAFNRTKV